jgi:DNA-binding transcriptional MerR regulator
MPTITNTDLLEIQDTEDTITPTELAELLREHGRAVSRRTLSFWQGEGLIPAALRVGARGGVYPYAVVDLAVFIADARDRGCSVDTIRELLPLWRYLIAAEANGHVELAELERRARALNLSREASYQVPFLVEHSMSRLCDDCRAALQWELKNGAIADTSNGLRLSFVLGELNASDGLGDIVAWTQLSLPGIGSQPDLDDPSLVVLGIPNGTEMRRTCCDAAATARRLRPPRRSCRVRTVRSKTTARRKEVLPVLF